MPSPVLIRSITLRTAIAVACLLGIWNSLSLARADFLFRQDTAKSVQSAINLEPDASVYSMRLAQLDESHAQQLLETALRLNQYNAQAGIELALRYEAAGDYSHAEKLLLQAFAVDRTYMPRWSLANFYLRQDNLPEFWTWAHRAAEMPADDMGALFELCWKVSPHPEQIAGTILPDNPEVIRQYLWFLLGKDQLRAAIGTASQLIREGKPYTDRPLLFSVVNRLVAANDATASHALWRELIQKHWIVAETTVPNNANFARDPLPVSFDWMLPSYPGLYSRPGPSGLEIEFSGVEPENSTIAEQTLMLMPGNYTMGCSYRTANIPPGTGIHWEVIDIKSNTTLAESPDLSSDALTHTGLEFSVGQDSSLLRLRLIYRRSLGTPRISGTLVIPSTVIEPRRSI